MSERNQKVEFGDFQTPLPLAQSVCELIERLGCRPRTIIEPSCGVGGFLDAAVSVFGDETTYYGFDINPDYVALAKQRFDDFHERASVHIHTQDFFSFDWEKFTAAEAHPLLFLGNPPWVTNSSLGALGADNLPEKSNLKRLSGLSARTGKANFDISEWMLLKLVEAAKKRPFSIAMLCKTSVARKALEHYWKSNNVPANSALYSIDAFGWFGASVDACLFFADFNQGVETEKTAFLYGTLDTVTPLARFGVIDDEVVADIEEYKHLRHLKGVNYHRWRSGIKHDLAKVMELRLVNGTFRNGFDQEVDVEGTYLYPLLKATEISKGITTPTRYVIVTQNAVGKDTSVLRETAPKTWRYLECYDALFSERKSSIYRNQPKYSLFGIGPYSFSPYKIAVSGLHKAVRFTLIPPYEGKPVFVDDTCYVVGSHNAKEATLLHELYSADVALGFFKAIIFSDNKRPVTADVLNRLDIKKVAEKLGKSEELTGFLSKGTVESDRQGLLVFESHRQGQSYSTLSKPK